LGDDVAMQISDTGPGRWISYTSRPGGKGHLPSGVREQVEQQEAEGVRLLCEVHVQVYDHEGVPYVSFSNGAALRVTMNTYTHVLTQLREDAADAIDRILGA
jgi:hypothetical protein